MAGGYLSTSEAAERCGVTAKTVGRWVDSGILPALFTSGGHRRIREADLTAFLESRRSLRASATEAALRTVVFGARHDGVRQLQAAAGRLMIPLAITRVETLLKAGLVIGDRRPDLIVIDLQGLMLEPVRLCADLRGTAPSNAAMLAVVAPEAGLSHDAGRLSRLAHRIVAGQLDGAQAEGLLQDAIGRAARS